MERDAAIAVAERDFPHGPESLAKVLGAIVEYAPMCGCDGWCVRRNRASIIYINGNSSLTRQRFTLAHELSHLILGTKPDVVLDPFKSDTAEERAADLLASELLIPESKARSFLGETLPVVAKTLQRLAKAANVSAIMAACRIVNMTHVLGLQNAAVSFFNSDGEYQWRFSSGLNFTDDEAVKLRFMAFEAAPTPVRAPNNDGNIVVASIIDAQGYYSALFLQLLPPDLANSKTREEQLAELIRGRVFGTDYSFQQSVASCLGHIRNKYAQFTVSQALSEFDGQYTSQKWSLLRQQLLMSPDGREYLKLELSKSCQSE